MPSRNNSEVQPLKLPRATSSITVVRVGTEANESTDPVHYVSVRRGVVLEGTIAELREFTGELGMAIAEVELDELRVQVNAGRRIAAEQLRRLA